jgi:hypothetical protein
MHVVTVRVDLSGAVPYIWNNMLYASVCSLVYMPGDGSGEQLAHISRLPAILPLRRRRCILLFHAPLRCCYLCSVGGKQEARKYRVFALARGKARYLARRAPRHAPWRFFVVCLARTRTHHRSLLVSTIPLPVLYSHT